MTDKIFSFSATETGYNHIKAEPSKVCEDASDFYDDEKMHICVVADGHGSDNYPRTDRGSQYAVDAAIEQIKAFVQKIYNPDPENPEKSEKESNELIEKFLHSKIDETHQLKNLSKSILIRWRELVDKDVEENPFHESEMLNVSDKYKKIYMSENISERRADKAYGCTLIAYVVTEKFSFGMQIGDGKCVVIDKNGTFSEPIPWDENCQMNVTTSICDSNAADEFRFFVTEEKPSAVFCGSDGIDDSYANVEEMYALYRSIIKIFIEYGSDVGKAEIKEYLPVLTKKGSGDDVSIAFIMDIQRVTELTPVFNAQTELFNFESQLKGHLMESETWMNANKAVELGFADGISEKADNAPIADAVMFSQRAVSNALMNKLNAKYKPTVTKQAEIPKQNEHSVNEIMERLNSIEKHI